VSCLSILASSGIALTDRSVIKIILIPFLNKRLTSRFEFKDIKRVYCRRGVITIGGGAGLLRRTLCITNVADSNDIAEKIRMYAKNA